MDSIELSGHQFEFEGGRSSRILMEIHHYIYWPGARNAYTRLLMSTVLRQNNTKQQFAVAYSHIYKQLFSEFLKDDQDHGVSIVSMSVQLFTVPTIVSAMII